MIKIGDLVMDEYQEKGIVTRKSRHDGYVEVTFIGGTYGALRCEVHEKFLVRIGKNKSGTT